MAPYNFTYSLICVLTAVFSLFINCTYSTVKLCQMLHIRLLCVNKKLLTYLLDDVVALLVRRRTCDLQVAVRILARYHCVVALRKLLTPVCLCRQPVWIPLFHQNPSDWRSGITASTTVRFLSTCDRSANPTQHHRRPIISCDCRTCMEQSSYQHHSVN